MDMNLRGQSVLITGSTRGIGLGVAEEFLKEKALVILTGRDKSSLNNTVTDFENRYGKNKVLYFGGALQLPHTLQSLNNFIIDKAGGLDHLICNIGSGQSVPPLEEDVTEFQRMLDINLLNAVGVITQLLPLLERSALGNIASTSITFIGSICGVEALGCPIAYASTKAALISYAKNISKPLGRRGIRVNVVSPGNIMFPGSTWEKKLSENREKVEGMLKKEIPLQCFGDISDVADIVVFLTSKRAKFVSGSNWVVDGGQTRS